MVPPGNLTPTEWFDQFPAQPQMDGHEQWCGRHWAPCPVMGANGIGAAVELMQIFIAEIAPPNTNSPEMLNRELAKAGQLCCKLGDERMYALWGRWGPGA